MATWVSTAADTSKMNPSDREELFKRWRQLAESFNYIKPSLELADKLKIITQFGELGIKQNELEKIVSPHPTIKSKSEIETELRIELMKLQIEGLNNKNWIERNPIGSIIITAIASPLVLKFIIWIIKILQIDKYLGNFILNLTN